MPHRDTLQMDFRSEVVHPIAIEPRSWRGFQIDHVCLETDEAYDFHSAGECHYLALHNLTLVDGELELDGLAPIRRTDLRDTLTFAPRGCTIKGWAKPTARANSFTALYFDPELMGRDLEGRYSHRAPPPFAYARNPRLAGTMRKLGSIARDPEVDDLYAELICLTAALEVLGIEPAPAGQLSAVQSKLVLDFIDANLDFGIGLDDLARVLGISRSHFSRAFKATMGVGPHRFVAAKRIARACEMLRSSRLPIEEIARAVGFRSAAVFRRTFLQINGRTPQAYRKST